MGHPTKVIQNEEPNIAYYMPYYGIYCPHKSTTKLRTLFNASAMTSNGNSLN